MSLFPTNRGPSHLVQFNAGKCIREGNMLKPDLRKGMIYMDQSDDQLMHFYWKERKGSAQPEDDLIIFPDEAEFVHVEQCTTGRVYLLKFKTSSQKLFFWMQNKNADKDEEVVNRVNRLIDDPHSAVDERSMSPTNMDLSADDSQDFSRILGGDDQDVNVTQEQLLQFLQTAGGMG
ncbi:proteasome complex subunit Rpn13 ubiquitin receptor-domain-containing protein [Radiomyces spectabilis]|uniref:proteasome complex subunit Rpn13 ubiquitin receptor-domain-containing protein n=1 Tax=Radiomyces spectabilis TaxID=64574 RepID=UPI00221F788B|nr:proteasome complex subunit Rpn13 ubiquitin receptor-domain-containing protein [Radiomyces spectabilis]KAI8371648.1 proteasome complex subunit Rpn13 ubiquitin receptor-domain-containing protein [Radiomyces spectabilis]